MLPKRLKSIVDNIPIGCRVADIGSDHGYLPIELVKRSYPKPIATEHALGPYQQCVQSIAGYEIDLRYGSGLAPILPNEVDLVVIAGMSGQTIMEILQESWNKVVQIPNFIFQPMVGAEELRLFLIERELGITKEWLVKERGRFYQYQFVVSEKITIPTELYHAYPNIEEEFLLKIGPSLLLNKSSLTHNFFLHQLAKLEKIINQLVAGKHEERYDFIMQQVVKWRQVIKCHTRLVNAPK